ncbi:MAG: mechanosensitive ion channel domain-containing protein [Candidatus Dormibacteraceae bacterium]
MRSLDNNVHDSHRARSWILSVVCTAALIVLLVEGQPAQHGGLVELVPRSFREGTRLGIVLAAGVLGALAVRGSIGGLFGSRVGPGIVMWRNLTSWTLYLLLALLVTGTLGVNLSGFLVGGAVFGVVAAVAAQSSLANFFAGLVLMVARPYAVGSWVHLKVWTGAGEYEGIVTDIGTVHTQISANGRIMRVPNSAVITAVLTTGNAPLQSDLELEVPRWTPLDMLQEQVRRRLLPSPGGAVVIEPRRLQAKNADSLVCRLTVRSPSPVAPGRFVQAVNEALEEVSANRSLAS